MGMGFILTGMIFLFNPFINIIDVLPDFIGYLLILHGISRIADLETKLSQAKIKMNHALYVSLGRFAVMALSFVADFDATLKLVFVFAFAVLDIFFVLPAFSSFFEGLEYAQFRFTDKSESQKLANAGKMTSVFLIVRSVGSVLPELTSLMTDYGYVQSGGGGLADNSVVRAMLTIICAAAVLVFGIVWLSMVWSALSEVRKNKMFISALEEKYAREILTDKALAMKRSVKGFWRIWFAAFFFLLCISIDYHYIVPEFAFGVCAFFAFQRAKDYDCEHRKTSILCFCSTGIMAAAYALLWRYSAHIGSDLFPYRNGDFLKYYLPYVLFSIAGYALIFLICKRANSLMKEMTKDGVGLRESMDARRREIDEERRRHICVRTDRLFKVECVYIAASAVLMAFVPWVSLAWALRTVFDVIVIIFIYSIMSDVSAEAEKVL